MLPKLPPAGCETIRVQVPSWLRRRASLAMQDVRGRLDQPFSSVAGLDAMTQDGDVQGLQSKAEARLASLKDEKLVTRIAVLSTSLGQGKTTNRLMIRMSVETHKTSPDFDQKKCDQAKGRIMQALGDIDCDVFIETER
jgi:hypothetical protein